MSDYRKAFEEKTGYKERNLNPPSDRHEYDWQFTLYLLKEIELRDKALKLACNELWLFHDAEKMPSYYIGKFNEEAKNE